MGLLKATVPVVAAGLVVYGWVQAHPQTLGARVVETASRQGQETLGNLVTRARRAARRYVASRRNGAAPTTYPIYQRPRPVTHPRAPQNVHIARWGTRGLEVAWTRSPGAYAYIVHVDGPSQNQWHTVAVPGTASAAIVGGLTPGNTHQVWVVARFIDGRYTYGLKSAVIEAQTWIPFREQKQLYADYIVTVWERAGSVPEGSHIGGYQGTAWLEQGSPDEWVTCDHAVRGDATGPDEWVILHNAGQSPFLGQQLWSRTTDENQREDLATISVHGWCALASGNDPGACQSLGLPLNTHPVWVGEPIAILGHPLGRHLTLSIGRITGKGIPDWDTKGYGIIPYMMTGNAWAAGGNSGSPVLNPWGQVIGVDESGMENGSRFEGIVPITGLQRPEWVPQPRPADYPPSPLGLIGEYLGAL